VDFRGRDALVRLKESSSSSTRVPEGG
jgi:hypothetical protein